MKRKFLIAGGIGCGSIMLIFVLIIVILLMSPDNGSLMLTNELEPYALEYLEKHKILKDSEKVLAYYDNTVSLDGSDVMILTSERLITRKNGKSTEIKLKDIKNVNHRHTALGFDYFIISSDSGKCMKIEIAPLNGGGSFITVLASARETVKQIQAGK
jgi:hypothetical protein